VRDGAGRTRNKKLKKMMIVERALSAWQAYLDAIAVVLR
jgi:hypothetical protein